MSLAVEKLKQTLKRALAEVGISAHVISEPVPHTGLFRFVVVSEQFAEMPHSERQEVVWRIAEGAIAASERRHISMIRTLTMDEIGEDELPRDKKELRGILKRRHERK